MKNWQRILKKEEAWTLRFDELVQELPDMLEKALLQDGFEPEGEWDEELEGYRNAEESDALGGILTSRPAMEHEEHSDVTTEFDLYYDGLFQELRVANYTGMDGIYITTDDWTDHDLLELGEVREQVERWLNRN